MVPVPGNNAQSTRLRRTITAVGGNPRPRPQSSHTASPSGASSPSMRSPAKSKPRRHSPARPRADTGMEVSGLQIADSSQDRPSSDPIAEFPTSDRPISDTMLKEMLLSLRSSLKSDMIKGINKCQREVQAMGHKVNQVERKMDEYASSSYNVLVDAHTAQGGEIAWLKDTRRFRGQIQKKRPQN